MVWSGASLPPLLPNLTLAGKTVAVSFLPDAVADGPATPPLAVDADGSPELAEPLTDVVPMVDEEAIEGLRTLKTIQDK